MLKQIEAGVLRIGYFDHGPSEGIPVLLLHGFPYDVHAYDAVSPLLVPILFPLREGTGRPGPTLS